MPQGDKVGDAYIEVHADLDDKSVQKAEAQLQKKLDKNISSNIKAQKSLSAQKIAAAKETFDNSIRLIDAQEKRQAKADRTAEVALQRRAAAVAHVAGIRARYEAQAAKEAKAQFDIDLSRKKHIEQEVLRLGKQEADDRRAGEKAADDYMKSELARVAKIEKAHFDIDEKIKERASRSNASSDSGARRGSNNRGEGVLGNLADIGRNVLSILPGQLEKTLESPAMFTAAASGFTAIFSTGLNAAAGVLAGGVGLVTLGAAIADLIKNDVQVAAAFSLLGQEANAAFLQQALAFKGPLLEAVGSFTRAAKAQISQLDFSGLASHLPAIGKGLEDTISHVGPAVQNLVDTSGPVLDSLATKDLPQISRAFEDLTVTIKQHTPEIVQSLGDIAGAVSGLIQVLNFLTPVTATVSDAYHGFLDSLQFKNARAQEGFWDTTIAGANDLINIFSGGAFNEIGEKLFPGDVVSKVVKMDTATKNYNNTLVSSADISNTAAAAVKGQEQAINDLITAQQTYDRTISTFLDQKAAFSDAILDIKKSIKDNGKEWRISTREGLNNFIATKGGLAQIKQSLLDAVAAHEITTTQAQALWKKQSSAALTAAGATGEAKTALEKYRTELGKFPQDTTINVDLIIHSNIQNTLDALKGLQGKAAQARADAKNKASGGRITGPGSETSDSIPANLSNNEFVVRASAAKSIGFNNLARMNATGKIPQGFAAGTAQIRSKTGGQLAQFNVLAKQIAALSKAIATQTSALDKFNQKQSEIVQALDQNASLANLSTDNASAGDLIGQLQGKRAQNTKWQNDIKKLKTLGLSTEAISQIISAGPDSPLAGILASGLGKVDAGIINKALGGDAASGAAITGTLLGKKPSAAQIAAEKAALKKKQAAAAKLKPPVGKGASIQYAGGKTYALFSKKELANQQFREGTYVTVIIDGKEVRAIVKQENAKASAKTGRSIKSGRT
jgi:hypothetical protein